MGLAVSALLVALMGGAQTSPTGPLIVAHRGASHDAPENTLAAFREAWRQGADFIEADFLLASDGSVVCIHDDTTARTGDRELVVSESSLDALRTVDVGAWKGKEFRGERIAALDEVLRDVPPGKGILVELKGGPAVAAPAARVALASGLGPERVAFIAFDPATVTAVKRAAPGLPTYLLSSFEQERGRWSPTVDELVAAARRAGADGVDVRAELRVVDSAFAARMRAEGLPWHVWTVDDGEIARRVAQLGAASITTNRPQYIRHVLATPPPVAR